MVDMLLSMPGDRRVTAGECPGYREESKVHTGKGTGATLRRASPIRTGIKCWVTSRVGLGHGGRCPLGRGWGREPQCLCTSGWRRDKRMNYVTQKSFLWVAGVPDHEPGGFQRRTSPSPAPGSLWPSRPGSASPAGIPRTLSPSQRLHAGSSQKRLIFISSVF